MLRISGICLLLLLSLTRLCAQRSDMPVLYNGITLLIIDKEGFERYMKVYRHVKTFGSKAAVPFVKQMIDDLRDFNINGESAATYRNWYELYFSEYDIYVENARKSTISLLEMYLDLVKKGTTEYYHDDFILHEWFAHETDYFFPKMWFVGNERYFSEPFRKKFTEVNPEAANLFQLSYFYFSFDKMNSLLSEHEDEIKQYLQIGQYGDDVWGYLKQDLIDYAYFYIDGFTAAYMLNTFTFEDQTGNPFYDMETANLQRYLSLAKDGKIWLVARFKK